MDERQEGHGDKNIRRIAIVGNQAFTLIRFRGPLIEALVARGYTVFALMPEATESELAAVRALGAEPRCFSLDRTGLNPLRDFVTLVSLTRVLRRLRVDLVFCYFIKPVIYGLWAARLAGVSRRFALIEGAGFAFAEEAVMSRKAGALRKSVTLLYRSALRHAHGVFFLNADDAKLFSDSGAVDSSRSIVIPGIGIDLDEYRASGLPHGQTTFIMLTRLLSQKGVREYASAAREVKKKHPNTRFVLLGGLETSPDGICRTEVRGWVADNVLEWPGRVDDVQAWLQLCHVFVLPSYYREGLPRSTLEAMAVGRAIITTDSVGCRDTVQDGENGFLVPARDVTALVYAMQCLIEQPETVARMGRASRGIAEEKFDVHSINAMFLRAMGL